MSGERSGESAGGHREESGHHGQESRVGDSLIGSEADSEGSAAGDAATAGAAQHDGGHGEEASVGDSPIGSYADSEGCAACDEAATGVSDQNAGEKAESDGRGADKGQTEVNLRPLEGV